MNEQKASRREANRQARELWRASPRGKLAKKICLWLLIGHAVLGVCTLPEVIYYGVNTEGTLGFYIYWAFYFGNKALSHGLMALPLTVGGLMLCQRDLKEACRYIGLWVAAESLSTFLGQLWEALDMSYIYTWDFLLLGAVLDTALDALLIALLGAIFLWVVYLFARQHLPQEMSLILPKTVGVMTFLSLFASEIVITIPFFIEEARGYLHVGSILAVVATYLLYGLMAYGAYRLSRRVLRQAQSLLG